MLLSPPGSCCDLHMCHELMVIVCICYWKVLLYLLLHERTTVKAEIITRKKFVRIRVSRKSVYNLESFPFLCRTISFLLFLQKNDYYNIKNLKLRSLPLLYNYVHMCKK